MSRRASRLLAPIAVAAIIARAMSFLFGLQKTRDSLKEAFEALFDKYGREFDDDDEIDIMSLEVVKHHQGRRTDAQRPKKFGFLYKKKGTKTCMRKLLFIAPQTTMHPTTRAATATMTVTMPPTWRES